MRTSRRALSLGLVALFWMAVFFGLYVLLVHVPAGRRVDEQLFNAVPRHHSIWFRLSGALIGSEPVWVFGGLAVAASVGLRRRLGRHLVVGFDSAAVTVVMAELLKHVLLSRPSSGASAAVSNSFPSGHTVVAAATVVAIWFVSRGRWRRGVVMAGSLLCVVVGMATVVQQWHRPSDVVSGFALAAACACAAGAILATLPGPDGTFRIDDEQQRQ